MPKALDLVEQHFGYLEVLEKAGHNSQGKVTWKCLCHNCGKIVEVPTRGLTSGEYKSCGCMKGNRITKDDLAGQKINNLTVIEYVGKSRWRCKCDCGNETIKKAQDLKSGRAKTCGKCVSQVEDLKGKIFGVQKVISLDKVEDGRAYWKCICTKCGKESIRTGQSLRNGKGISCRCCVDKTDNLVGQTFGRLTVIERVENNKDGQAMWKCVCGCGKEVVVSGKNLKNGNTKSCGCLKKEHRYDDISGKRYGYLEVLSLAYIEDKKVYWNCLCHNCGNEKIVRGESMKNGKIISCGCLTPSHNGSQVENEIKEFVEELMNMKRTETTFSLVENEIGNYVNNLGHETTKDKTILDGKEIDIYIPELKLGIEYNGSPFHASVNAAFSNNKPMGYHRDKFLLAKEKGIHLISIFDVDWTNNEEKIKNYIKYLIESKRRIYARKCELVKLSDDIACAFVDKWHLQGSNKATMKINYGLYYTEGKFKNLVAVMSFGIPRLKKQEGKEYELHRYCVAENYIILGGAERLLHQFDVEYAPDKIISYSDNDYFIGGIYEKLGFENRGQCKPRYYWFKNGQEIRRERCQLKHLKVEYPELLQEAYNVDASNKEDYVMVALGACKVYRSGNTKWEKIYKGSENDG